MAKNILKAWKVDNTVSQDEKADKILLLETTRSVDQEFVLERMAALNPGVLKETMRLAVNLHNQVVADLVLNGYSVNTGLFRAAAQFKGVIKNNQWDPTTNSIYVSLTQGKQLREDIKNTTVQILGDKQGAIYISESINAATRATNFSATSGRNFIVYGKGLTIAGTDASVGVTLKSIATSTLTKLTDDMIVVNEPSRLIILIPSNLSDGEYELTITTQFSSTTRLLKNPRATSQTIYIGEAPEEGGGTDNPEDNPLG